LEKAQQTSADQWELIQTLLEAVWWVRARDRPRDAKKATVVNMDNKTMVVSRKIAGLWV